MTHVPNTSDRHRRVTRARRRVPRLVGMVAMAAVALSAAACSSSPTAATTTTVKLNTATATSDITNVFETVFDLANPSEAPKIAEIQDGSAINASFAEALNSSLAKSAAGSKIDSVSILSASGCRTAKVSSPCAYITYDILGPTGTAILPNSKGYAVYVNGQWLMAKATICGLLGLFYNAEGKTGSPTGC